MKVLREFKVIEHYADAAPEDFGFEVLDHVPNPDDIIMLHWSDGREAYPVRVESVDYEEQHLHVRPLIGTP